MHLNFSEILPLITGGGGVLVGLLTVLPSIRKIGNAVNVFKKDAQRIYETYKDGLAPKVRYDLETLIRDLDDVTEATADAAGKLRLKTLEKDLRNMIPRDWYKDLTEVN